MFTGFAITGTDRPMWALQISYDVWMRNHNHLMQQVYLRKMEDQQSTYNENTSKSARKQVHFEDDYYDYNDKHSCFTQKNMLARGWRTLQQLFQRIRRKVSRNHAITSKSYCYYGRVVPYPFDVEMKQL